MLGSVGEGFAVYILAVGRKLSMNHTKLRILSVGDADFYFQLRRLEHFGEHSLIKAEVEQFSAAEKSSPRDGCATSKQSTVQSFNASTTSASKFSHIFSEYLNNFSDRVSLLIWFCEKKRIYIYIYIFVHICA